MSTWIWITIGAALMQALRTSLQKHLSTLTSATTTTLARYFYALPLVWLYWAILALDQTEITLHWSSRFWIYAVLAALAQIVATLLMVRLFQQRNFAIGVTYAKTETILVAVLGIVFFGDHLSLWGWCSVLVGSIGIGLLSPRIQVTSASITTRLWAFLLSPSAAIGVASGLCFALASLWLRQASLSLNEDAFFSAATTLAVMITIQWVIMMGHQLYQSPSQLKPLLQQWPLALGVGVTSLLGSMGWFTAMTLENPALVKTLGQIEFFFTLMIAMRIFKERFAWREWIGMAAIMLSILGILQL